MIAYRILDADFSNSDAEIRAAYLRRLKSYPPERCPNEFQTIRKAYEMIESEQKRIEYFLFGNDIQFDLDEYESLLITVDKQLTKEKWDSLCQIYQKNR